MLPEQDSRGSSNSFTSVTIYALPNAGAVWAGYVAGYGDYANSPPACNSTEQINARCWWSGITDDGTWIEITYAGMRNSGDEATNVQNFTGLVDSVVAAAMSAPRGTEWHPPTSSAITLGCPSVLSADEIAAAIGTTADSVTFSSGPIGDTSLLFEAASALGADDCRWFTPLTVAEYGDSYSVLRGGAWAWDTARTADPSIASAEPLLVSGLKNSDSAWIRRPGAVIVDLIVAGDWISLTVFPDDLAAYGADEEVMTMLAEAVLLSIY